MSKEHVIDLFNLVEESTWNVEQIQIPWITTGKILSKLCIMKSVWMTLEII